MCDDFEPDAPFQFGRPARVIVMAMSDQQVSYKLRLDPALPYVCQKLFRCPAASRIYQG